MLFRNRLKLRFAIGLLVIVSVVLTAFFSWISAMSAMKDTLKQKYLDSNYFYAQKLALSTSDLLSTMINNLIAISDNVRETSYTQADLDTWRAANNSYFNSIFIMDETGFIQAISPNGLYRARNALTSQDPKITAMIQEALKQKVPFISEPYTNSYGQRILLITVPIFNNLGHYIGLVGGSIYLESNNVIEKLLNDHQYDDGSYVYVVDQQGHIIFHPDPQRINDDVTKNKIVQQVIKGNNGSEQIINTKGHEFFAGYAYEENSGWGIISQTPVAVMKEPIQLLLWKMIIQDLPLLLIILLFAMLLTNNLAKPINTLAKYSEEAIKNKTIGPINHIKTNIYEVYHLYQHINDYLNLLKMQIQIDGLTGLFNRKTLDSIMKEWIDRKTPFSIILLDIDRFKKVNDTYGHLVGDEVLKYLAKLIRHQDKEKEFMCFRYGGEEFVILLKNKNEKVAYDIAEQIRKEVAKTNSPTGKPITISLGISSYQKEDRSPECIIKRADAALYHSKTVGRNKTTIHSSKMCERSNKESGNNTLTQSQ